MSQYKEKWISGRLYWKLSTDNKWIPFNLTQYKNRVIKLEDEIKVLKGKIKQPNLV